MDYSMYICPKCHKTYKVKGPGKKVKCPTCTDILLDLGMEENAWRLLDSQNRDRIIKDLLNKSEIRKPIEPEEQKIPNNKSSFFSDDSSSNNNTHESTGINNNPAAKDNINNNTQKSGISKGIVAIIIGISAILLIVGICIGVIIKNKDNSSKTADKSTNDYSYSSELDDHVDETIDDNAQNSEVENFTSDWIIYDCDPKLLDLSPKIVIGPKPIGNLEFSMNDPNPEEKFMDYKAIKTFCIQLDDIVFDASEGVLTAQAFVERLKAGNEGSSYSFWIENGTEKYDPERLMNDSVQIIVAKNGYGYCYCTFVNYETTPKPIGDFISYEISIYPCEPVVFDENGITDSYNEALAVSSFIDSNNYKKDYNYYALQNIWFIGGLRFDGTKADGSKLKYTDADAFFESIGLSHIDKIVFQHEMEGHYITESTYDKKNVFLKGYVLGYECIYEHPKDNDKLMMCSIEYMLEFDLRTQECYHSGVNVRYEPVYTKTGNVCIDGLIYDKGMELEVR